MPKTSRATASKAQRVEGIVDDRSEDLDGYTVSFTKFLGEMNGAPLLCGAPDDRCQCPHWGYVIEGKITFHFPDREETYEAGDAYYAPPGLAVVSSDRRVGLPHCADQHRLGQGAGRLAAP